MPKAEILHAQLTDETMEMVAMKKEDYCTVVTTSERACRHGTMFGLVCTHGCRCWSTDANISLDNIIIASCLPELQVLTSGLSSGVGLVAPK